MMNKLIIFCVLFWSLCSGVSGKSVDFPESWALKDGTVYENVKLITRTPSEVVLRYSGGAKNIKISELTKELQQLLNYSEPDAIAIMQAEETALSLKSLEDEAKARADFPESLALKNGTVYEDVKLISWTPSEVVFRYSGGVKNVKISELPEEVQQLLNYSESDAIATEVAQAEKTTLRLKKEEDVVKARGDAKILAEKKKHVFMIRGYVHRVLDDGILIQAGVPTDLIYNGIKVSENEVSKRKYKSYPNARPQREFGLLYVAGHPRFEYFTDADVIDIDVYRDGIFRSEGETRKKFVFLKDY